MYIPSECECTSKGEACRGTMPEEAMMWLTCINDLADQAMVWRTCITNGFTVALATSCSKVELLSNSTIHHQSLNIGVVHLGSFFLHLSSMIQAQILELMERDWKCPDNICVHCLSNRG